MATILDVQYARSQFPSLASGYTYADSAGGSQALKSVADAVYDYLINTNVQLGASYTVSQLSTGRVDHGADVAAILFNAESRDEIAFGPSTTQLLANLARAISPRLKDTDEIIITGEHEANVGPWKYIAKERSNPLTLKTWFPKSVNPKNPYDVSYNAAHSELLSLVTDNTRVVALSGCSNLLGEILDFETVVKSIRAKNSNVWIVVDLVAYAPHKVIDVKKWDVDFAVFSFYKVYGPHVAALYTRRSELAKIASVAHHFHSPNYDSHPFKLQPGGPGYELTYGSSAVLPYLYRLSQVEGDLINSKELLQTKSKNELREALERTSDLFRDHERRLMERLLGFLTSSTLYNRGVRVVGPESLTWRAPTIGFIVIKSEQGEALSSRDIVEQVDKKGTIGIRWGHMYAYTIVTTLPNFSVHPSSGERSVDDGVVRISLVHYHTVEDVDKIIDALSDILKVKV
ncbi:hypothetical protein Clacol_008353 [Clathrus columnatus]|uniref:Aminotransferase class V domain-containing protein n=1 Tax=Clathrus columnatus TaxID=1419009 RepID=A0AAV5AMF8_9AGAM|nr:hypothetical protein Clacol_008353 [Clathrus columnatus]